MTELPTEIVVVFMNQADHPQITSAVPLRFEDLQSANPLPLAESRNRAADLSTTQNLLFLDVDCIPHANYATVMLDALELYGGLVMGSPLYLPSGKPHPALERLPDGHSDNYNLFWSLCFAITLRDFNRVGGFDESYVGYGAEDTDFAWSARRAGVTFAHCGANVYHQHHDGYSPPLNHFDDIVENARAFFRKWRRWPMEGWLQAFVDRGHIEWDTNASDITVLSKPNSAQIEAVRNGEDF